MGILSKIRERKAAKKGVEKEEQPAQQPAQQPVQQASSPIVPLSKPRKKRTKKEVDIEKSLAMYIVSLEVLIASYFEENDDFVKLYDRFRTDWKVEDLISNVANYDSLFKMAYREVNKWLSDMKS